MANLTAEADLSNLSQKVTFQNQAQAQKDIQNQTQQAKEEVQKSLVPDAIFIVNETKKAINFIKNGQMAEALSAVENATGKSDVLLARHPENALLPVDFCY
nr:YfdX family protein [Candidatus Protochlamydia amoebophila]